MRSLNHSILPAVFAFIALPSALAQYSIRNIEIRGAAPYTDAEVLQVSGLRPGQRMTHNSLGDAAQHLLDTGTAYDPIYAANFLTRNTALLNLAGYTASSQAAADIQTHLVDLTIHFVRPAGR